MIVSSWNIGMFLENCKLIQDWCVLRRLESHARL